MFEFITQYKEKVIGISNSLPKLARLFYAVGLADAYVLMVRTFMERAIGHPEVSRTPAMLDAMLEHFQTYPLAHINIDKNQIFDTEFVGTLSHLEAWQQAGYPLARSEEDYG